MRDAQADNDQTSLQACLRSIARTPAPDAEEASRLLRELTRLRRLAERSGSVRDFDAWQELRHEVVVSHMRLVVHCVFRWRYYGVSLLDQVQEGNLGLIEAVDRFDPDRKVPFANYAAWWIRGYILRAIENQRRTVRLPSHVYAAQRRTRRLEQELCVKLRRKPHPDELAAALNISPEVLDHLRLVTARSVSIDRGSNGTGVRLGEMLADTSTPSPDASAMRSWAQRVFERGLSGIDDRTRRVLALRWGLDGNLPMTQREVGRLMGVSRERVHQIERAAFKRLRKRRDLRKLLSAFG